MVILCFIIHLFLRVFKSQLRWTHYSLYLYNTRDLVLPVQHFDLRQIHTLPKSAAPVMRENASLIVLVLIVLFLMVFRPH